MQCDPNKLDNLNKSKNDREVLQPFALEVYRTKNPIDEDYSIIPLLDEKDIGPVVEMIQKAYSIDRDDEDAMYFENFDIANDYYVRKLYFAHKQENLFHFEYPKSLEFKK